MDSTTVAEVQGAVNCTVTPEKESTLDFSQVSCSQLGISTQSFIPSAQGKDKSRLFQLKMRRRSSIGVRGSPDTNSLIRFIARKRSQTPPSTPQNQHTSPFVQRSFSALRQKMASFQSLLDVDEKLELLPRKDSENEGFHEGSALATKENMDPHGCLTSAVPPFCKKNCLEIVGECKEVLPLCLTNNSSLTLGTPGLEACPSEVQNCESCTVPLHNGQNVSYSQDLLYESPLTKHPTDEVACPGNTSRKKKSVRFGAPLSPELFDKTLPPSTPLQKGGTPARASTSAEPQLRPLLKTPQRSVSHFPQPNFTSPEVADLAPTSDGPSCTEAWCDPASHHDEVGEEMTLSIATEKTFDITCTSTDVASQVCTENNVKSTSPPELHLSPQHDTFSGMETAVEQYMSVASERFSVSEPVPPCAFEPLQCTAVPALVPPRSRKRKQPDANVIVKKRTNRTAAMSATRRIKDSSSKKRWGTKEVDRSLYGKRDYASKNPTLSPITETLLSASRSPTPQRCHSSNRHLEEDTYAVLEAPRAPLRVMGCSNSTLAAVTAAARFRQRFSFLRVEHAAEDQFAKMAQETNHPGNMTNLSHEVEAPTLCEHKLVQLPGSGQQGKRSKGGRGSWKNRGRGRGKAQGGVLSSNLPFVDGVTEGAVSEKDGESNNEHLVDHTDTRAGPLLCSSSFSSVSPGNRPKPIAGSPTAECSAEDMQAGRNFRKQDVQMCSPTDHKNLARCEPYTQVAAESDVQFSLQSGRENEFMDRKPKAKKKNRAQGKVHSLRSSQVQSSFITDEAVGLGTQTDTPATVHMGNVQQKGPEDLSVFVREAGEEGFLEQGSGLKKESAGETEKSFNSTEQVSSRSLSLPEWAQFSIEDVLKPLPRAQRSVRRSLRNQSNADSTEAGLAWVPRVSPVSVKAVRRRSKCYTAPALPEDPAL